MARRINDKTVTTIRSNISLFNDFHNKSLKTKIENSPASLSSIVHCIVASQTVQTMLQWLEILCVLKINRLNNNNNNGSFGEETTAAVLKSEIMKMKQKRDTMRWRDKSYKTNNFKLRFMSTASHERIYTKTLLHTIIIGGVSSSFYLPFIPWWKDS